MTSNKNNYYVTIIATNSFGSTNYNVNVFMIKCVEQTENYGFYNYGAGFYDKHYLEIDPLSLNTYTHTTQLPQYTRYETWCNPYTTTWWYR